MEPHLLGFFLLPLDERKCNRSGEEMKANEINFSRRTNANNNNINGQVGSFTFICCARMHFILMFSEFFFYFIKRKMRKTSIQLILFPSID